MLSPLNDNNHHKYIATVHKNNIDKLCGILIIKIICDVHATINDVMSSVFF